MIKRTSLATCTIAAVCLPTPMLMGQSGVQWHHLGRTMETSRFGSRCGIDQHFSQRGRFERLAHAVERFPDRVGIGIDEATGILLSREGMQVFGSGSVYLFRSDSNKDFSQAVSAEQVGLFPMQFKGLKTSRHPSGSKLPQDRWNRIVTQTNNAETTN